MSEPTENGAPEPGDTDDLDVRAAFDLPSDEIWLNCAHQGPLPRAAAAAAKRAVAWKQRPWELTTERFSGVPLRLKETLARLLGGTVEELILANGASYGLHLLANGLPLAAGDRVLVMRDDFPSNLLPWRGLATRGIEVREIEAEGFVPTIAEVERALTERTRVVCLSWVHSFSGHVVDLGALGTVCRAAGAWLVVNATQGIGARPLDVRRLEIDALVGAGWKWLCGPYATGYLWATPELLDRLHYNQAYWLSAQTADDLGSTTLPDPSKAPPARRYDLFGTANFFNFVPWTASLELLLELGVDRIHRHDRQRVHQLCRGLEEMGLTILGPPLAGAPPGGATSPRPGNEHDTAASIVVFAHPDPERNAPIHRALAERRIHLALRRGRLRASPHLYNTAEEIDRTLDALRSLV